MLFETGIEDLESRFSAVLGLELAPKEVGAGVNVAQGSRFEFLGGEGLEEDAGVFQPTVTQASAEWTLRVVAPPQEQEE